MLPCARLPAPSICERAPNLPARSKLHELALIAALPGFALLASRITPRKVQARSHACDVLASIVAVQLPALLCIMRGLHGCNTSKDTVSLQVCGLRCNIERNATSCVAMCLLAGGA